MYGVNVKITGIFAGEPSGVFGKYNIAFSSTLSRNGISTPHRRSSADGGCAVDGAGVGDCATMFVAKPAHKAAARSDDFIFVVIEASQGEDKSLFVLPAPASSHRFEGLQPRQFARR